MISRVADHCFWLGRYLERAESTARVLAVTRHGALDAELTAQQSWQPVIIVAGEEERFPGDPADGEAVQHYMTWAEANPSCIRRSIGSARENARSIREVVSLEVWETLNELHVWLSGAPARSEYTGHRYNFYREIRKATQLCLGLMRSTMLHDTPLNFIWLGVMLERVGQTARLLDVHHHALTLLAERHQVVETALWLSLLRACSGFEPFMKRNQARVTGHAVAGFLMFEPRFPRSVRYCVEAAYERLCKIRPPAQHELPGGKSLERLRLVDQFLAGKAAEPLDPGAIHDTLTYVVDETQATCDEICRELLGVAAPASLA